MHYSILLILLYYYKPSQIFLSFFLAINNLWIGSASLRYSQVWRPWQEKFAIRTARVFFSIMSFRHCDIPHNSTVWPIPDCTCDYKFFKHLLHLHSSKEIKKPSVTLFKIAWKLGDKDKQVWKSLKFFSVLPWIVLKMVFLCVFDYKCQKYSNFQETIQFKRRIKYPLGLVLLREPGVGPLPVHKKIRWKYNV